MIYLIDIKNTLDVYLLDSLLGDLGYEDIGYIKSISFCEDRPGICCLQIKTIDKHYHCDTYTRFGKDKKTNLLEVIKILKEKLT